MIQTESPSAGVPVSVGPSPCEYILIPDGSKHTGLLQRAISENENHYIITVGTASFLVPRMVTTKGGLVNLAAWVGLEVEVSRYGERVFARLVPPDEQQMRIWELEELIARHIKEKVVGGVLYRGDCVIPSQEAMEALRLSLDQDFNWQKFCKYSTPKAKREKALAAVVE